MKFMSVERYFAIVETDYTYIICRRQLGGDKPALWISVDTAAHVRWLAAGSQQMSIEFVCYYQVPYIVQRSSGFVSMKMAYRQVFNFRCIWVDSGREMMTLRHSECRLRGIIFSWIHSQSGTFIFIWKQLIRESQNVKFRQCKKMNDRGLWVNRLLSACNQNYLRFSCRTLGKNRSADRHPVWPVKCLPCFMCQKHFDFGYCLSRERLLFAYLSPNCSGHNFPTGNQECRALD